MGGGAFIPIILPNYNVSYNGSSLPFGHAGFLLVSPDGTATYDEFGLYFNNSPLVVTNNGTATIADSNIRQIKLGTNLQFDSSGNVTAVSLQAALNEIFGGSGLYVGDTGEAIVTPFSITNEQFDQIQQYTAEQITAVGQGRDTYSIQGANDCMNFVYNTASAASLTISSVQNSTTLLSGGMPISAMPITGAAQTLNQAGGGYQYFGPNSWAPNGLNAIPAAPGGYSLPQQINALSAADTIIQWDVGILNPAIWGNAIGASALNLLKKFPQIATTPGAVTLNLDGSQLFASDNTGDAATFLLGSGQTYNVQSGQTAFDVYGYQGNQVIGAPGATVCIGNNAVTQFGSAGGTTTIIPQDGGPAMSITFEGTPTIQVAPLGGSASGGNGPCSFLVGYGNSALTGGSGQNTILALGDNDTVTGGGGTDQVGIDCIGDIINEFNAVISAADAAGFTVNGNDNQLNLETNDTVNDFSNNSNISGSQDTINVGNGDYAVLNGNADNITLNTGSSMAVTGVSNYMTASNDVISMGAASTLAVNGSGDQVTVSPNDTLNASGATVNMSPGESDAVNGTGDNVMEGNNSGAPDNDTVYLTGGGDEIGMAGPGDAAVIESGSGYTVYGGGPGTVDAPAGTYLFAVASNIGFSLGNGSTLEVGTGSYAISANGSGITVTGDASSNFTVYGGSNQVNAGIGDGISDFATNTTINGSQDTINVGNGDYAVLNGSSDAITLNTGSSMNLTGAGDVMTAWSDNIGLGASTSLTLTGNGDQIGISGSGDSLGASGEGIFFVAPNANLALGGTANSVYLDAAGETLTLSGDSNGVIPVANDTVNDYATNTTIDGSQDTINVGNGDYAVLNGNSDNITLNTGSSMNLTGTGDVMTAWNDSISLGASTSLNITGNGDQIGISSSNDSLGASGEGIFFVAPNANLALGGTSNTVYLDAGGETLTLYGDSNGIVPVANDTINDDATNTTIDGSQDIINVGNGDYAVLNGILDNVTLNYESSIYLTGAGNVMTAWNDGINLGASTSLTLSGNGDTVVLNGAGSAGDVLTLSSGDVGETVAANGDTISALYNVAFTLTGNGDYAILNGAGSTGDVLTLSSGDANETVAANGDTISALNNVAFTLTGNSDNVILNGAGSTSDVLTLASGDQSDQVTANSDWISIGQGDSGTVNGSFDGLLLGAGVSVNVSGTSDKINAAGTNDVITASGEQIFAWNQTLIILGNDDTVHGNSDHIIVDGSYDETHGNDDLITLNAGSHDFAYGSGDSDPDGTYGPNGSSNTTFSWFGGSAMTHLSKNVVGQYDLAQGNQIAASSADIGWAFAQQAIAAASDPKATTPPAFEGPQWAAGATITWSLAAPIGKLAGLFSGTVQSQYLAAIQQAFTTWAAASGLTFKQVDNASGADINIVWGALSSADSGVLGYTAYHAKIGLFQQGVTITLENPADDPLVGGANSNFTYAGTGVTLYQLALHEIGHALGLGESSLPSSIMFPELGASDTGLDASDISNIQQLYNSSSNIDSAFNALVQSMSSVGATNPALTIAPGLLPPNFNEATLATAHH